MGISSLQNPSYAYQKDTIYSVTLSVFTKNHCKSVLTKNNYITVKPLEKIYIPTAFSPNGDGVNDILFVYGEIKDMSFVIYNQWGLKVFSSNNPLSGWDGKYKGQDQPEGNYTYVLTGNNLADRPIIINGIISLIR